LAGTVTTSCVAVCDDGTSAKVFTLTVDVVLKFVPFTVKAKAGAPAVIVEGLMVVMAGF
jgi:hypothetical protein